MEPKTTILVVEDEPNIRIGLRDFLEFHGFDVVEAIDGLEARRATAERRFDLILLDLMLPKVSGEELCAAWRREGLVIPIVMVTAKGQPKERIDGLDLGADDYVTKPFSLEELLARIRAILRRVDPSRTVGRRFQFGDLEVDAADLKAWRDGQPVELSARETKIIQYFAANPHRVISRPELYEKVWGETYSDFGTRTTDMHIAKLRGKIERDPAHPEIIQTVRGAGYRYGG